MGCTMTELDETFGWCKSGYVLKNVAASEASVAFRSEANDETIERFEVEGILLEVASYFAPHLDVNEYDEGLWAERSIRSRIHAVNSVDVTMYLPESESAVLIRPNAAPILEAVGEPTTLDELVDSAWRKGCVVNSVNIAGIEGRCWAGIDGDFWVAFVPYDSKLLQISLLCKRRKNNVTVDEIVCGEQFRKILDGISL